MHAIICNRGIATSRAGGRPTLFLYQQTLDVSIRVCVRRFLRSLRIDEIRRLSDWLPAEQVFDSSIVWLAGTTNYHCEYFNGRERQREDLGADIFFGYLAVWVLFGHHKARLPELSSSPYQLPPLFHRFSFSSFPLRDRRTWELTETRIICIINICHLLSIIVNKCEVWKQKNFLQNPSDPYLNCTYWPYRWKKALTMHRSYDERTKRSRL